MKNYYNNVLSFGLLAIFFGSFFDVHALGECDSSSLYCSSAGDNGCPSNKSYRCKVVDENVADFIGHDTACVLKNTGCNTVSNCDVPPDPEGVDGWATSREGLNVAVSKCGGSSCPDGHVCVSTPILVEFADLGECVRAEHDPFGSQCLIPTGQLGCDLPGKICEEDPNVRCFVHPDQYGDGVCTLCAGGNPSYEGVVCDSDDPSLGTICCNLSDVGGGDMSFLRCLEFSIGVMTCQASVVHEVCDSPLRANLEDCYFNGGGKNELCASDNCVSTPGPGGTIDWICMAPQNGEPCGNTAMNCACNNDNSIDGPSFCVAGVCSDDPTPGCADEGQLCGDLFEPCCDLDNYYCSVGHCKEDSDCVPLFRGNPADLSNPAYNCIESKDCCNSGPGGTKCEYVTIGTSGWVCIQDTSCAHLGQGCSGTVPCCDVNHRCDSDTLKCVLGNLPGPGDTCQIAGCDGCAANGYGCNAAGICEWDTRCIEVYEPPPYSGPVLDIEQLLGTIFGVLYPVGIAIGVIFNVKAGYCYMTSEGEPQKLKDCSEQLTHAILGTLFILLSIVILRVIINTILGVSDVTPLVSF